MIRPLPLQIIVCFANAGSPPTLGHAMNIRYTIIGPDGAVSFAAPGHVLKMLTAIVSAGQANPEQVLAELDRLDDTIGVKVRRELLIFDEHCVPGDTTGIDQWISATSSTDRGAFRVLNEATRRASIEADQLGLVIFNLCERRIVQIQNRYGELLRQDRGRLRRNGKPLGRFYAYELPADWSIVP
jgi:hypothetical protein